VEAIIDLLMKPQTEMQVATSTSANAGIILRLPLALFVAFGERRRRKTFMRTGFEWQSKIIHLALAISLVVSLLPLTVATVEADGSTIIVEEPTLTPSYGPICETFWYRFRNNRGYYAYLTLNTNDPGQSINSGIWVPNLPEAGEYKVEAYIASHSSIYWPCPSKYIYWDTSDARYEIRHAGGTKIVYRNQKPLFNEWLYLGTYYFNAGRSGYVRLTDLNGESNLSRTINFSAMRFTRQAQKPTVETRRATSISKTGAILNGRIVNDGGSSIIERRLDWGTTPDCSDGWTANVSVSGNYFSYYLTDLNPGKTYYFRAWAKNSAGWSWGAVLSFTTQPNQPPIASLSANPRSGNAPLEVTFTMSASDPDGRISAWILRPGDGSPDYSGLGSPPSTKTHTYRDPGNYTAILMVMDNDDATDADTETIVVGENEPPTCSLRADPGSGRAPLDVTFTMNASDSDGWISAWVLSPGDGSPNYSGSGSPPSTKTHTYRDPGNYTAVLMVTDNDGATDADTETIHVEPPQPCPSAPSLNSIDNSDCDGNYTVRWSPVSEATRYELQEDDNSLFSSPTTVYQGSSTSKYITGKSPDTYYYRVRAFTASCTTEWSTPRSVRVWPIPSSPTLYSISNTDGDGNYTVRWSPVSEATRYELQEDDNSLFSSPTTVYSGSSTSKGISGKSPGTYYYQVRASNCRGDSGWSNWRSVRVEAPSDTTPPTVNAFSVHPSFVVEGDAFTIDYTVSDTGGSGLNRVELWRTIDAYGVPADWAWTEITRTSISGDSHSGSFSDAPPSQGLQSGLYWYGLHVVDNAGNLNDERNSTTGGSPGVYGPIKVRVNPSPLPGLGGDLELSRVHYEPQPVEFEPFDLILTVKNTSSGRYEPLDGHYTVEFIVNEHLGFIPGKSWSFVFDSKRAYDSKYMSPARLPELAPGQELEIRVQDLYMPRMIDSHLKVTLTADGDIFPDNNSAYVEGFYVDPIPTIEDCLWIAPRVIVRVVFLKLGFSLGTYASEEFSLSFLKYWRAVHECHGAHCLANATRDFLTDILHIIPWNPKEWLIGFFAGLTDSALDLGECFWYILNLIRDLISSCTTAGIPLNVAFTESPVYVLVTNSSGQRAGFLDDGTIVQEIEGAQVLSQDGVKFVFYPGSDTDTVRVKGTATGTYDLSLLLSIGEGGVVEEGLYGFEGNSVESGDVVAFAVADIPITDVAVHEYTGDWAAFAQDGSGVTRRIDSDGDGTFEQTIEIQAPMASFTYSPESPTSGQTITFDATSSYDPDGEITSYKWDFGDGWTFEGETSTATHSYSSGGDYTVILTVRDNDGAINTSTTTITVTPIYEVYLPFILKNYP